ncbi:MAG TPA: hypothetical protein PK358_08835 [Spirochaetota bacterium]|nr:hypothetical protein [Spirochaetota bacterium]HPJ34924.1 hypothetical protein [Spirochaetota bacterium]
MKKQVMRLLLPVIISAAMALQASDIRTYEGVAERSKAGLVVAGVMITTMPEEDIEKFAGKRLRVRGLVEKNHKWRVDDKDPVKRQGFNMPVMYEVISIEIIED